MVQFEDTFAAKVALKVFHEISYLSSAGAESDQAGKKGRSERLLADSEAPVCLTEYV
jgi:hypothetical protein